MKSNRIISYNNKNKNTIQFVVIVLCSCWDGRSIHSIIWPPLGYLALVYKVYQIPIILDSINSLRVKSLQNTVEM